MRVSRSGGLESASGPMKPRESAAPAARNLAWGVRSLAIRSDAASMQGIEGVEELSWVLYSCLR